MFGARLISSAARGKQALHALALLVALALPRPMDAQDIIRHGPFFFDRSDPSTIFLAGEIDTRSGLNFSRILDASGEAMNLVLVSDGGLVHVGLSIALEIRRQGLNTFVPAGFGCYSACSFLWFAGTVRDAEGEIGVHQLASATGDLTSGQVAIGDIVDVLSGFDVPSEVIVRMLQTPSSEMHVFSIAELERYGLVRQQTAAKRPPAQGTLRPASPSIEQNAVSFVARYNEDWSRANHEAIPRIRSQYATQIEFYGNTWSRERVMHEKQTFADRWPVRDYFLDIPTARADCDQSICVVTGEVAWDARSPERGAVSRGRALVEITLEARGSSFLIVGEGGRVVSRP